MSLHSCLAAECACVARVLGDFDLLDLLTEGGTVTITTLLVSCGRWRCGPVSRFAGCVGCAYRVPYLPVMPTFFVAFVIAAVVSGGD